MATNGENYIDNKKLLEHMKDYKDRKRKDPAAQIDTYTAKAIMKIVERFASRKNFAGYTYREDMVSGAVENILLYIDNFDPEKSSNPFSYFTQIAYYSFLRKIREEKTQTYVRLKSIQKFYSEDKVSELQDADHSEEGVDFSMDNPLYDNMEEFIDNFEKNAEESRRKNRAYTRQNKKEDTLGRRTGGIQSRYKPLPFTQEVDEE